MSTVCVSLGGALSLPRRWLAGALLVIVAVLTVPGSYGAIGTGLDPSWVWGINAFRPAGFRFGRDVIFSYGPLGYLTRPLDIARNLPTATFIHFAVHIAIFATA